MRQQIDVLELFSGIGGFSVGLTDAGFEIVDHYYSEVDKHAIANYKYNFPHAKYIGSVKNVRHIIRTVRKSDRKLILTFGSPCQDFSLAGKGKGLEGSKSSLIKYAIFLIKWIKPDVFIWENVKGAYSTNDGADYWAIIQAFANLDGYRCEQQLLNTSWFLPQNRERIYFIGHLAGRSEPGVFPIREAIGLRNGWGQKSGEIESTLNASDNESWVGNFVKVAHVSRTDESKAIRKESMKNGKDYSPFQGKKIEFVDSDIMNTVTCATQKDNLIQIGDFRSDEGFRERKDGNCPTIQARAREDGSGQPQIKSESGIRRLTEIECERLQGFPDDWTKFGNYDGVVKEIPRTQRYKMCGNAVTTVVVKAIAERLNFNQQTIT